ncbi:MAG: two-component system, OmpR family, response regulator [Thermomicrobiales bacterium]|nr:two-component system, OmpR family, response regulator [Thermomicrobiales bacterium]MEA2527330.1 two-component system, OmpR family, response regulator [Thermomicrobiales bacterium]MEA2582275.1 two-component system, OmpR family, response regulator [Thermomicrobiales bacterium]MEA2597617.1 two-component system, OmpR family, response regulator [Thermomicrobiales bacterium]
MARTVLVADDEPPIRDLVGEILRAAGYEVCLATDGLDALDQALTIRPDLVLTDFKMPNLDGLALAKRLRERDHSLPILLMSAAPPSVTSPGIEFIRKPFNIPQLVNAVASALAVEA